MVVIKKDTEEANVTQAACETMQAEASIQAASAKAIADDAQRDLDEALPALEVAVKCLRELKLAHIQEVKVLANPPSGVKLTMEVMCMYFDVAPVKEKDPNDPTKKILDYWKPAKEKILNDPKKLLENLFNFDKDNIPEKVIEKVQPYVKGDKAELFTPEMIKKASVACEAMCLWSRAMYIYHGVSKSVEPKRQALAAAEAELKKNLANKIFGYLARCEFWLKLGW